MRVPVKTLPVGYEFTYRQMKGKVHYQESFTTYVEWEKDSMYKCSFIHPESRVKVKFPRKLKKQYKNETC